MRIETNRLLLRDIAPQDVEPLARLWSDPLVTKFMGGPRDYARMIAVFTGDVAAPEHPAYDLWPVIEKASGALAGYCGIADKEVDGALEYELVYVFSPPAWGCGYASEIAGALVQWGFDQAGLQRIIALIEPENFASVRVAQNAGLRFEKETLRPGGRVMQVYAIQKTDRPQTGMQPNGFTA